MIRSRVEYLAGVRWAKELCFDSKALLQVEGGPARLLEMLRWGLKQKPADFVTGVQEIIDIVEGGIKS